MNKPIMQEHGQIINPPQDPERTPDPIKKNRNRRLIFYHANPKGTGVAAQFELRLNREGEDRYDCIFLEMAHQKTTALAEDRQKGPATFDWANKVIVKLDFIDICDFLLVMEGRKDQAGNGNGGIYHEAAGTNALISFKKNAEHGGYFLGVSKKSREGAQVFKGHILLSEVEAMGLCCVFKTALFFMAFGTNPSAVGE